LNLPQQAPANSREQLLLIAGATAYKQMRGFRIAFYVSVVCNIIMFILMNGGLK